MKYRILLLLLFVSVTIYAQKFEGGLSAGFTASQVDGDTYSGYHRAGLSGGVFIGLPFNNKWAGQFEMKYNEKGSYRGQNPDNGDYTTYGIKLRYIEMPLSVKYIYKPKLNFESGLALGYLAGSTEKYNGDVMLGANPFNKFEFSYLIGGSVYLYKKLIFNIRYSYSILPIRAHSGGAVYYNNRGQYNNVVAFSFYYKFGAKNE